MKKVSVIVPAYNAEEYIEECLNSICKQTYENIEIVVIDDGSKDGTASIIRQFADRDLRVCAFFNENHGVSYSRNYGIEKSNGEYVTFVDADDIVSPSFVAQMVCDLEKYDADMAAVGMIKSKSFSQERFTDGETIVYENSEVLKQLFESYGGFLCNKLFRYRLLQTNRIRLEHKIAVCEDLLFNVEYLKHCKKSVYNSGEKYFYRQSENSASYRLDNIRWFDSMEVYQRILNITKDIPEVYETVEYSYAMFLGAAKYRIRFIYDKNGQLKLKIEEEWKRIHKCWRQFSLKKRIKLYLFDLAPGIVTRYQRRKL